MSSHLALNACRACGATNYRRVIARDDNGDLKPTGLYQCSGCSVVFANPKAWRDGGVDELDARARHRSTQERVSGADVNGTASSPGGAQNVPAIPQNRPDLA